MKKGYIYKITSPSNRIYIGQTNNINGRMNGYKNKGAKGQPKLYNSLIKYGWELHQFEILEEIEYNKLYLNYLEKFYIRTFDTLDNGLNCTEGGDCGPILEETKLKISNSKKGHKVSIKTRNKISNSLKGSTISDETKEKIKKSMIGKNKRDPWNKGKIGVYSKQTLFMMSKSAKNRMLSVKINKSI